MALVTIPPHELTAMSINEDLDHLITRLSRIQKGQDRTADAKLKPLAAALKRLREAKTYVDVSLVPKD